MPFRNGKEKLILKYQSVIREKAISRTKKRLATANRSTDQFAEDELEVIVKEEEEKVKADIRNGSFLVALVLLGIG